MDCAVRETLEETGLRLRSAPIPEGEQANHRHAWPLFQDSRSPADTSFTWACHGGALRTSAPAATCRNQYAQSCAHTPSCSIHTSIYTSIHSYISTMCPLLQASCTATA